MIKSVGIILNHRKPQCLKIAKELFAWLEGKGIRVVFPLDTAELLGKPEAGLRKAQLVEQTDMFISLGGDGTLLLSARIAGDSGKPILGVNLGQFGFLVAVEPEFVYNSLEKVLAGDFLYDHRMVLKSTVYRNGEPVNVGYGLNDVVINKAGFSRMIRLETFVNHDFVNNYPADGIIISSPTGSTGYSLSAGGPIVSPKLDLIIITPICPHTLYSRPLIIPPDEQVKVILEAADCEVVQTIDGQLGFMLQKGDQVVVERAPYRSTLIKFPGRTFYDVVRNKLNKGERNE